MARQWAKFEGDVKKLIASITGFHELDENFGLCLQYAQSNILYHQFLTVDSHKINRAVKGLEEKFSVHSDEKKAKALRDLTERFLDSPVFEYEEHGRTDTHYAILSLLINLANAPLNKDYVPRKERKKQEIEDDFDWKAHLLDGENVYNGPFPPTPEWSEEEDSDEDEGARVRPKPSTVKFSGVETCTFMRTKYQAPVTFATSDDEGFPGDSQNDNWLSRNVMTHYWNRRANVHLDISLSREGSLSNDWDEFLLSRNQLYVPDEKVFLSEYQLLREVLWMISGIKSTFVFILKEGKFTVRTGIQVAHLTKDALENLLNEACKYGNIMIKLGDFIEEVTSALCHYDSQGLPDMRTCQTHQAFAGVLAKVLQEVKNDIMSMEREIALQENPTTLMKTMESLRTRLPELYLLEKVYEDGIVAVKDKSNVERASHLLSVLYSVLLDLDTFGPDVNMVVLILRVWCQTSRPYLDIVDLWISQGNLSDPYREFLVQRNSEVNSLDESFWNTAFTIHVPLQDGLPEPKDHKKKINNKPRKPSVTEADPESKIESGSLDPENESLALAPEFLQPVLRQIILTGKSMEMMQALGRLSDIIDDRQTKDGIRDSLYETFIKNLQNHIGIKNADGKVFSKIEEEPPPPKGKDSVYAPQIIEQIRVKGVYDPLLQQNFSALFNKDTFHSISLTERDDRLERGFADLDLGHLVPVGPMLEKCLYPQVLGRYQAVCTHLLDVLKNDYHLMDHFCTIRKFFLMDAGDTMFDFYTEVFDKLRLHEHWQDMSFLNMYLQEAASMHHSHSIDRLVITLSDPHTEVDQSHRRVRDTQPINALDDIRMHYKAPWPISVILNAESFKVYNAVFSFLLQIKRSKYCLDRLRFSDLERQALPDGLDDPLNFSGGTTAQKEAARADRIHRMHIFRMKLMHFINSLHTYIMTRILHSTGLEFQESVEQARDLDEVIACHNKYTENLHSRCLLHHMVRFLKVAITKVMNLALTFQVCWDEGVDSVSEKHLAGLETEFGRFNQFLGSFLNIVVKRGSHPHLESLAYALLASNEKGKTPEHKWTK